METKVEQETTAELKKLEITEEEETIKQTDISKCWKCTRKLGLQGFQCKCKYYFCANHRYNDRHDCTFDYRNNQKTILTGTLEKVEKAKIEEL